MVFSGGIEWENWPEMGNELESRSCLSNVLHRPSRHDVVSTSVRRLYDIGDVVYSSYKRWNDVVCLLRNTFSGKISRNSKDITFGVVLLKGCAAGVSMRFFRRFQRIIFQNTF